MTSSVEVWEEAKRRARNHLRLGLVEQGLKPGKVAKMNIERQVMEMLAEDGGEYLRVAFFRFGIEEDEDPNRTTRD